MSKIGTLNLELQGQANDLGYSTVQEATDDGCVVDFRDKRLVTPLELRMNDEQNEAHEAWLKRKDYILRQLKRLSRSNLPLYQLKIVKETIEFIEDGEV